MAVSTDILRTWAGPRGVYARLFAGGKREDRALAFLMAGLFVVFVSRLPVIQRTAIMGEPSVIVPEAAAEFTRDAAYTFFGLMMLAPLLFYVLAEVVRLAASGLGLRVSSWAGRVAAFWAWLAASPMALLYGLAAGFNGTSEPATQVVGAIWLAAFVWFWVQGLRAGAGAKAG